MFGGSINMTDDISASREFFDKMAASWDSRFKAGEEKLAALNILCPAPRGGRALDIACGTGVLFPMLLSAGVSELWGVDVSPKMLDEAKRKFPDPRVSLFCGDFLGFGETGFDCAFIYRAYPHFHDKAAFAKKLHSVLKDGGRFIIAHNESRQSINERHKKTASHVSDILSDAKTEAKIFEGLFDIDITADTDYLYVISGRKI